MKQAEFENNHQEFWQQFQQLLENINNKQSDIEGFPQQYRKLCQHLAIAKSRRYAAGLCNKLNELVQQGYDVLYGSKSGHNTALLDFLFVGFPASLRANLSYIWTACALFVLPGLLMWLACFLNEDMIFSLMRPEDVRMIEYMYEPELEKFGRERQSDSDLLMFGFYIKNNIGISFRCFATGIFFCLGSIFFLLFNGLSIGAIAGHLSNLGYNETFYPFVIGHGSFELTAIVFSGAAGLKLGYSLLAPGAYKRIDALQIAAKDAIKIIYGSTVMLLIAAFLEAFWSSSSELPVSVKLSVGAMLWVFVIYYCFFSGKPRHAIK